MSKYLLMVWQSIHPSVKMHCHWKWSHPMLRVSQDTAMILEGSQPMLGRWVELEGKPKILAFPHGYLLFG